MSLPYTWHDVGAELTIPVVWLRGELAHGNQPGFAVEPTVMASPGKRLKKGNFVTRKNYSLKKIKQ
jgi:hypothetical protein